MPRIFISYRHRDAGVEAGRLFDRLTRAFREGNVFKDEEYGTLGQDLWDKIAVAVSQCDTMLLLIGPHWLSLLEEHNPSEDFVRFEVLAALEQNIRLIPVLLPGVDMPSRQDLERVDSGLATVADRQGVKVDFAGDFDTTIAPLIAKLWAQPGERTIVTNMEIEPRLRDFYDGLNQRIRAPLGRNQEETVIWLTALGQIRKAVWNLEEKFAGVFRQGECTVSEEHLAKIEREIDKTINLDFQYFNEYLPFIKDGPAQPYSIYTDVGVSFKAAAPYRWIVDPIDGARHFRRSLPIFTTNATLCHLNKPVATMLYVPVTGELFFAVKKLGAFLNNWETPLSVSDAAMGDDDAMLHVEFPNLTLKESLEYGDEFEPLCHAVSRLMRTAYRVRGLGCGSLALAYVAKGAFEGYVTLPGTTQWTDVQAGILLVKEANGLVCVQSPTGVVENGVRVIAANNESFEQLKNTIKLPNDGKWVDV